ncbi:MAG: hypothetical protein KBG15_14290, partial [Kofleriaceae bacterium]|nr:hypothetical protein [Kofleriaceae bacterium]
MAGNTVVSSEIPKMRKPKRILSSMISRASSLSMAASVPYPSLHPCNNLVQHRALTWGFRRRIPSTWHQRST